MEFHTHSLNVVMSYHKINKNYLAGFNHDT
jgi:hypothetical protein